VVTVVIGCVASAASSSLPTDQTRSVTLTGWPKFRQQQTPPSLPDALSGGMRPRRPPAPKAPKKASAEAAGAEYRHWKAEAAAELVKRDVDAKSVPEREWRQAFIRGKTPKEGADQAEAWRMNFSRRREPRRR
jgi:hypothetical protein